MLVSATVGALGSWLYDVARGQNPPTLGELVLATWRWLVPSYALTAVLVHWAHQSYQRERRAAAIGLRGEASALDPQAFGYRLLEWALDGKPSLLRGRPYPPYIPRTCEDLHNSPGDRKRREAESQIVSDLTGGYGVLLVGPMLAGKRRTLFEAIRSLVGWIVIAPEPHQLSCPDDAFQELTGHRVVFVLLNLPRFVGYGRDLGAFANRLDEHGVDWVPAATSLSGADLDSVLAGPDEQLRQFCERFSRRLALVPPTDEERIALASGIGWRGRPSLVGDARSVSQLGAIAMGPRMELVRSVFWRLGTQERSVLHALKLLDAAEIRPLTIRRVQAVLDKMYAQPVTEITLRRAIKRLCSLGFLTNVDDTSSLQPELVYVRNDSIVPYRSSVKPIDDFIQLTNMLVDDANALVQLSAGWLRAGQPSGALACANLAACAQRANTLVLRARLFALLSLSRWRPARNTARKILARDRSDWAAWWAIGMFYEHDQVDHRMALTLFGKANILGAPGEVFWKEQAEAQHEVGEIGAAVRTCVRAIRANRAGYSIWFRFLELLYVHKDWDRWAVAWSDRAIGLLTDPNSLELWVDAQAYAAGGARAELLGKNFGASIWAIRASALVRQRRFVEATDSYGEAVARAGDQAGWRVSLAVALAAVGAVEQSLGSFAIARQLDPDEHEAYCHAVGLYLLLGDFQTAATLMRGAERTDPTCPDTYAGGAILLANSVREMDAPAQQAARASLCRVWLARDALSNPFRKALDRVMHQSGWDPAGCEQSQSA